MQITLDTEPRDYLRKLRKKEHNKKPYIKILVILALGAGHYRYAAVYQHVGVEDYLKQN